MTSAFPLPLSLSLSPAHKARAHGDHAAAGGADGAPPSARVLLAKERAMLDALHEELEQQCASGLEAAA